MRKSLLSYIILFSLVSYFMISCYQTDSNNLDIGRYSREQLDSLTLNSLKKVDDYPFYAMTYYGDYGFDHYLNGRKDYPVTWDNHNLKIAKRLCSCFASMGKKSDLLYGRNFDYHNSIPLLLHTKPHNGYASISMVDIQFFGYDRSNHLPDSLNSRKDLLNAPWLPIDGINEKGVTIALLGVNEEQPPFDPHKITINEVALIRLVLDYATDTEHAISLIQKYNVNTSRVDNEPEHFLIADPGGNSAIIEFLDKKMIVIKNEKQWQVATNFNVHRFPGKNTIKCERYKFADKYLTEKRGNLTTLEAMKLLENVAQYNSTKWSCVYNMSNFELHIAVGTRYNTIYMTSLKQFDKILPVHLK